jgi:glutathione peroxidase
MPNFDKAIQVSFVLCALTLMQGTTLANGTKPADTKDVKGTCPAALNHKAAPLLDDKAESLCKHSGKVVLVVNTASQCGFTPQYEGLEKIYRKYAAQGFVVLGFPANDFGSQEKGNNEQIAKFCKLNFGVSFPMHQKLERPIAAEPLFAGLIAQTKTAPQWNFHKYLIGRDGKVQTFDSAVEPESKTLTQAIELAVKSEPIKR